MSALDRIKKQVEENPHDYRKELLICLCVDSRLEL